MLLTVLWLETLVVRVFGFIFLNEKFLKEATGEGLTLNENLVSADFGTGLLIIGENFGGGLTTFESIFFFVLFSAFDFPTS